MHAGIAVDPKPKTVFCDLIVYTIAELDNVFLKRFVTCWVIQDFPDDAGVAGPQDIILRHTHQITDPKTRHKANCITRQAVV